MKRILLFAFIVLAGGITSYGQAANVKTKGFLSFRIEGLTYKADSSHARAYSIKATRNAFLSGANQSNMIMDLQWDKYNGVGTYIINKSQGKAELVINHQTYTFIRPDDFIKVTITGIREKENLLLLKGNFEGRLRLQNGKEIMISEGKFETYHL